MPLGKHSLLRGIAYENSRVERLGNAPDGAYLVLTDEQRDVLRQSRRLEPLQLSEPPRPASPEGYWIYRLMPNEGG
jgi:hypothetical protein